ncbi:MAG: GNAT family N-acetyltransferase [Bacteroidales bacterium]|nr:GNAT family N-acetyltransferase [Bacteroidales bacterium]
MILYVKHNEIDKERWDTSVTRALNTRIYAYSWYLDIISPGWDALVEGDYKSIFPLTHHQKGGVPYLFQPFFAQQLGLFSDTIITHEKMEEFIHAIPPTFRFVEIQLNSMNIVTGEEGKIPSRINHELDLGSSYSELISKYAQNTRRNLKKAQNAGLEVRQTVTSNELVSLFRENFGKQEGKLKDCHYSMMQQVIEEGMKQGKGVLCGSFTSTGELDAAAFFILDQARAYYLFAASSSGARENGAMFLLIDNFVKNRANKSLILDFEGGNDPNLGRFYKSFGAKEVYYPRLIINRLPGIIQPLQRLWREIRR